MAVSATSARPPGPKGGPVRGVLSEFLADPLGFLQLCAAEYGDVVKLRIFNRPLYFVNHPDHIKHVLVDNHRNYRKGRALRATHRITGKGLLTSEGELHLRQRRLAQPAFHRQRIADLADMLTTLTVAHLAGWRSGETRDLHREMMQLTMAIVAKALFDFDVRGEADELGAALTSLMEDFDLALLGPLGQLLQRLPTPRQRRQERYAQILDDAMYGLINERRASGEDKGDLLSMLLQAQDVAGDGTGMDDEQVRDEVMTLFIAGHETTANALTWTFYLLSEHPQVAQTLHAELDSTLGRRVPRAADVPDLRYTRMVFAEAMRLYPPAWAQGREAMGDDEIGGFRIRQGSSVMMSQWVMHRDPRYWEAPDDFRPERFEPDSPVAQGRPRYAYFPFGGGPRQCIGEPFAWMEGTLLLATIAQHYTFRLAPTATVAPEPQITLRPRHGMPMQLVAR